MIIVSLANQDAKDVMDLNVYNVLKEHIQLEMNVGSAIFPAGNALINQLVIYVSLPLL